MILEGRRGASTQAIGTIEVVRARHESIFKKDLAEHPKVTIKFYVLAILHKISSINISSTPNMTGGPKRPKNNLKQVLGSKLNNLDS